MMALRVRVPPQSGALSWENFGKRVADVINEHDAAIGVLGGELLDAVNITFNPVIAAAAFTAETDIPRWRHAADVVAGSAYLFTGQLLYNMSNTDTESTVRIRHDTGLVGSFRLSRPAFAGTGRLTSWWIPWVCTATESAKNFYFSVQRFGGTGTTLFEGGMHWSGMYRVSRNAAVVRTVST